MGKLTRKEKVMEAEEKLIEYSERPRVINQIKGFFIGLVESTTGTLGEVFEFLF